MKDFQVHPESLRSDPSNPGLTIPKTFGVWELPVGASEKIYRIGNNPVRGNELNRKYGKAKLVALYTSRDQAIEHAHDLNKRDT